MSTEWLLAKYVPDLRRRESRNVGVVLFTEGRVLMRFRGQRDGSISARAANVGEPEAYRGWIAYWQHLARTGAEPEQWFARRRSFDNYWLEPGGEILSGEPVDGDELLTDLYRTLVEDESDHEDRLTERVNALLRDADLLRSEHFYHHYRIAAVRTGEEYEYPYGYQNGHIAIADQMTRLRPRLARTRLWEFRYLPPTVRKIVFTRQASEDRSVEILRDVADVLEVDRTTPDQVRELFLTPAPPRTLNL